MNKGIEAETAGTPGALTRSLARDLDEEDHKMLLPSGDKRGAQRRTAGRGHTPEAVSKIWAGKWDVEREVQH